MRTAVTLDPRQPAAALSQGVIIHTVGVLEAE